MIFSSYAFVLVLLPALLALLVPLQHRPAAARLFLLVGASLFFYGWYDWTYLSLLLGSAAVNFVLADRIEAARAFSGRGAAFLTLVGVALNLGLLGYFKYADFFLETANGLFGANLPLQHVLLPIGISFFTFQQIAYLVDVRTGEPAARTFGPYLLFIAFFPQLIAGPIVHHRELMPQVADGWAGRLRADYFSAGLTLFVIGLAKKVLIADQVARWSTPVFDAAASGGSPALLESWCGALSYTFQIYFDFSGYSDMAIGLGLMLGLRLPVNFDSPYKAASVVDFWRRWHITLSRFLRDYLYIPLGGNRKGPARRHANLMIVMLLGGLWHGAGWTFVVWGGLHGLGLVANHLWARVRPAVIPRRLAVPLTFAFVVVAWVPFRAVDMASAFDVWRGMAGLNGIVLPANYGTRLGGLAGAAEAAGVRFVDTGLFLGVEQIAALGLLLALVWLAPNGLRLIGYTLTGGPRSLPTGRLGWQPAAGWALGCSAVFIASLYFMNRAGEFLYYAF